MAATGVSKELSIKNNDYIVASPIFFEIMDNSKSDLRRILNFSTPLMDKFILVMDINQGIRIIK